MNADSIFSLRKITEKKAPCAHHLDVHGKKRYSSTHS